MRVLLIHPEDDLLEGPWASQQWGRVIDLGTAGEESYARAVKTFGCPINRLAEFRNDFNEMRRVRELIGLGLNRLNDEFGLDWWELTSILVHQQFELSFLIGELAKALGPRDEVFVSRPCFHADVLQTLPGLRVRTFPSPARQKRGVRHYLRVAKKFPPQQLLEIFWDKTDSGYQFRGALSTRPKPQPDGVVLLPSCYVNVSRTEAAYAESLPEARFLLITTRRSGWMDHPPANVTQTWLRRYASVRVGSRWKECGELIERWNGLLSELNAVPEFRTLSELGIFDEFPDRFARGLEIRDAWRNVLDSEPIQAVICADDSNPYTHIPLWLAKNRGIPAIAAHHGALDGRYMFKGSHADTVLAKGEMEADYLVRVCGVSKKIVEVGAPVARRGVAPKTASLEKSSIVFFSEAYEVSGGRARSFYEDVLPALAALALVEGKKLVVKLHPSESVPERSKLVREVLSNEQQGVSTVISGPLKDEIFDDAWCGVSVMSTVVAECAMRGIPCFLCAWLESWPYGYGAQFDRFEAGIRLDHREKIAEIPRLLHSHRASARIRENCWTEIEPARLRSMLGLAAAGNEFERNAITRSA